MANEFVLEVHKRDLDNKNSRTRLRNESKIPGVYYSHDSKESIPLYILESDLNRAKKSSAKIFTITVGDKKRNVLFKSVQYHPVTDEIMHIDLYGFKMDQVVSINVSIRLIGEPIGVTDEGGILVQGLAELEIDCLPMDIPKFIEVDVSEISLGNNIRVSDIDLDEKLTLKTDPNQTLASVTQAMKEEEPVVEEVEEGDEEIDGESDESGEETASDDTPTDDDKPSDKSNKEDKTK